MNTKILYITASDSDEAEKIGKALLKEKLCACVNIFPKIKSIYWWKKELKESSEALLLCKTFEEKLEKIREKVKELHSYDKPCIKVIEAEQLNEDYLKWMTKVIK